jgi:hypothetical protein
LSDQQKKEFSKIKPVERQIIKTTNIPNPNWIAGFTCGEGCFSVNISKGQTKIGHSVSLRFSIAQHKRDLKLMEKIINYLGCGLINTNS